MARFGVYRNPERSGYLLDLQAELLDHLATRVVAPLLPLDRAPKAAATLNPIFEIEGESAVMVTQAMAAVPARLLKDRVSSLAARRDEITAAVDLLFEGF